MKTLSRRFFLTLLSSILLLPLHAQPDDRPIEKDSPAETVASNSLPTLWIAGDSTLKSSAPMRGWGQDLGTFFDPAKINVVNRAIGGRSARTYFTQNRFKEIVDAVKPGDFVIIQFGHNDVGPTDARGKFRGSLKGVGDETESVVLENGETEVVHTYGWYLKEMVRSAKEKKAKVILCSPIPHKAFDKNDKFIHDWKDYRGWVETCAKDGGAVYIDLAEIIAKSYDKLDKATIESYFADKGTHTNATGSMFNAKCVISGMRAIKSGPLDQYMNAQGLEVPKH